jgi:hypothetical protein
VEVLRKKSDIVYEMTEETIMLVQKPKQNVQVSTCNTDDLESNNTSNSP